MSDPAVQQSHDAESVKPRRYYLYLSACALVACVVVRAPSIFEEGKIPVVDLKLKLNAGWILIFGPLLIVCAVAVIAYIHRSTDPSTISERPVAGIVARAIPCLAAAFLSLQFFLLFAPKGECNTFPRLNLLTAWQLKAFQPEYCMSLSAETQAQMPYFLNPPALNAWAQVILPLIAIFFGDRRLAVCASPATYFAARQSLNQPPAGNVVPSWVGFSAGRGQWAECGARLATMSRAMRISPNC